LREHDVALYSQADRAAGVTRGRKEAVVAGVGSLVGCVLQGSLGDEGERYEDTKGQ